MPRAGVFIFALVQFRSLKNADFLFDIRQDPLYVYNLCFFADQKSPSACRGFPNGRKGLRGLESVRWSFTQRSS